MSDVIEGSAICILTAADFSRTFQSDLSTSLVERIKERDFRYWVPVELERERLMARIRRTVRNEALPVSGEKRLPIWDQGWAYHLRELRRSPMHQALIPGYFGKYPIVRWGGELIAPCTTDFEYGCLEILQYWLFERLFKHDLAVCEFGCGTGHNLMRVREVNKAATLWGTDWASSSVEILRSLGDRNLFSHRFDMFEPDRHFPVLGCGVFTCAALEQIGTRFEPFINYLVAGKPRMVLHIEPIEELLDPTRELDALSIAYARKRGYLSGFLTHLRSRSDIVIHETLATGIGSLFLDGYQIMIWSPK